MGKDEPKAGKSTQKTPRHIAIIMDGNGRWARKRGLPRIAGHRAGTENLRKIIRACVDLGVQYLTIYAFSTENWARPKEEVEGSNPDSHTGRRTTTTAQAVATKMVLEPGISFRPLVLMMGRNDRGIKGTL